MNFKANIICIALSALLTVVAAGCSPGPTPTSRYFHDNRAADTQSMNREEYARLCTELKLQPIEQSVKDSEAVAEYRVTGDVGLLGYNYYDLQEHKDGSGTFTCILYRFTSGKIVLNVSKDLTTEETKNLLDTINSNRFWSIPEVDPNLKSGCDGMTVFVEGYKDHQRQFAGWWCPDENTALTNIDMAFSLFADTFAKEPEPTET